MDELVGPLVRDEQAALDQGFDHVRDAGIAVRVELGARDSAAGQRFAVTARDQTQQDTARDLPTVVVE